MILIIGSPQEEHSAYVHDKIKQRGHSAVYLDTLSFPLHTKISLFPDRSQPGFLQTAEGVRIPLADIRSVYWRNYMGINIPAELSDQFQREMAYREIDSCVGSMFRMMGHCLWMNSPEAIDMHVYKTYQLQLMHRRGIRIPQTLVTNDAEQLRAFYERLNAKVIYKPVRGGAHTAKLEDQDFTPERLGELAQSPVQFQEMVEGVDIRVYLIGNELFAAEIRSKTLDFRDDPGAAIVPVELPDRVAADCITLARTLGLAMSGIDVRRTPEGEYVFLEGNPAPMFIHFEKQTGYPISDRLVDMLISPNEGSRSRKQMDSSWVG
jgi:hypothetical protein